MSMTTNMPSLFGRATAVLGEHAAIRGTMARLRTACAALGDTGFGAADETSRLLQEFHDQAMEHFAAEESDGYFGTLVVECPSLAERVAALRAEHVDMAGTLRRLCELSRDGGREHELRPTLVGFLAQFQAHERAENHLLQEFFSLDEGGSG